MSPSLGNSLDFFAGEPTFDTTKTLVLKVLKHEIEPQSSMTPTP